MDGAETDAMLYVYWQGGDPILGAKRGAIVGITRPKLPPRVQLIAHSKSDLPSVPESERHDGAAAEAKGSVVGGAPISLAGAEERGDLLRGFPVGRVAEGLSKQ